MYINLARLLHTDVLKVVNITFHDGNLNMYKINEEDFNTSEDHCPLNSKDLAFHPS